MSNTTHAALSTISTRRGPLHTSAIIAAAVASLFGVTAPLAINALETLPASGTVTTAPVSAEAEALTSVQPMVRAR